MAHMKKTNQARERVSPHIKKGNDAPGQQKEFKRTSIEARLKELKEANVRSIANFSTASNDEYTDKPATAARS